MSSYHMWWNSLHYSVWITIFSQFTCKNIFFWPCYFFCINTQLSSSWLLLLFTSFTYSSVHVLTLYPLLVYHHVLHWCLLCMHYEKLFYVYFYVYYSLSFTYCFCKCFCHHVSLAYCFYMNFVFGYACVMFIFVCWHWFLFWCDLFLCDGTKGFTKIVHVLGKEFRLILDKSSINCAIKLLSSCMNWRSHIACVRRLDLKAGWKALLWNYCSVLNCYICFFHKKNFVTSQSDTGGATASSQISHKRWYLLFHTISN